MSRDREGVRQFLDYQERGRDYGFVELAGYAEWSKRKIEAGVPPELIAFLDATAMFLLPEEAEQISEDDFEEVLAELKEDFGIE